MRSLQTVTAGQWVVVKDMDDSILGLVVRRDNGDSGVTSLHCKFGTG